MIYSLPTEAKLDILKFLNYEELYSIKQTNLYFRDFITHFEGELARDELFMIILRDIGQSNNGRLIRPGAGNFNFALFDEQHKEINEQLEEKWNKELENPIPLYLPLQDSDNTVICLSKKVKFEDFINEKNHINLQLPTIIKNKNQMKIVYYYLDRLFICSFEYGFFNKFIFNPELIKLLFGNATIPKKFYVVSSSLKSFEAYNSENLLKFAVNHLIGIDLVINFSHENNTADSVDILSKILMNGDKFKSVSLGCSNSPELYDFVINFIKTSKDCSKMVDKIDLIANDLDTNLAILNEKAEKVGEERVNEYRPDYLAPKYQLFNIYNPKIKFSILYNGGFGGMITNEFFVDNK